MIDTKILIGLGLLAGFLIALRLLRAFAAKESEVEKELLHVLESDDYKVRGRFE